MDDLDRYIAEQMKDTAFRAEHERTRLEFALTELLISSRMEQDLTQKELADRSGVRQSNISRIEKGQAIPSLAGAMDVLKNRSHSASVKS